MHRGKWGIPPDASGTARQALVTYNADEPVYPSTASPALDELSYTARQELEQELEKEKLRRKCQSWTDSIKRRQPIRILGTKLAYAIRMNDGMLYQQYE